MKKILYYNKVLMAVCLIATILTACTNEVLVTKATEQRKAYVQFQFDWSALKKNDITPPDSMLILIDKTVYQHMNTVGYDTRTESGMYISELPESLDPEDNHDIKTFEIRPGEYKFISMNRNSFNFDYSTLENFVSKKLDIPLSSVKASYLTYSAEELNIPPRLAAGNRYKNNDGTEAKFILNDISPVLMGEVPIQKIAENTTTKQTITPKSITQTVDLSFDVRKDQRRARIEIDSAYIIVAGIPRSVQFSNGALDVSCTDKMITTVELTKVDNNTVRCHQKLNVTGIMDEPTETNDKYNGRGIVEFLIMYTENGKTARYCRGYINIRKSIKDAELQIFDYDQDCYRKTRDYTALHVPATIIIGDGDGEDGDADNPVKWEIYEIIPEIDIY